MAKQVTEDSTISFKIKLTALISIGVCIFSIGMLYSSYLDLETHVKALESREEIACTKVNDMYNSLGKISENITWIKDALKNSKKDGK